jgi:uncharacterized protein DUF6894
MARYFFSIKMRDRVIPDEEGSEFSNPDLACQEAIEAAREIVAEFAFAGKDLDVEAIVITDSENQRLATLSLEDFLPSARN